MSFDLTGKTARVTGASSGIGYSMAQVLSEAGDFITGSEPLVDDGQSLAL